MRLAFSLPYIDILFWHVSSLRPHFSAKVNVLVVTVAQRWNAFTIHPGLISLLIPNISCQRREGKCVYRNVVDNW